MTNKKNKKTKELTAAQEAEIRQGPQFIPLADFVSNTILCHGLHETYEKAEDGTMKQVVLVKKLLLPKIKKMQKETMYLATTEK